LCSGTYSRNSSFHITKIKAEKGSIWLNQQIQRELPKPELMKYMKTKYN